MASVELAEPNKALARRIVPLESGDHLTRAEFERRYAAMPEDKKAELIEGVVYVSSPIRDDHAGPHADLIAWLVHYRAATPGVAVSDNGTVRLDEDNEPQPDAFLRILEESGGQYHIDEDGYVAGAPELAAEVALSSVSIDLHDKLQVYRRNGVREYVVWRVADQAIDWFILREGRFDRLQLNESGIYRSEVFPGLWLDPSALIGGDMKKVFETVQQGLGTLQHNEFVKSLQGAAAKTKGAAQRSGT
jgi:Uma2 family endonuclease